MDRRELKRWLREKVYAEGALLEDTSAEAVARLIDELFEKLRREHGIKVSQEHRPSLTAELVADVTGYGPITVLMQDERVTEVMVNGPYRIYAERAGIKQLTDLHFDDENHLKGQIYKMMRHTGRRVDESSPYVDFSLTDGSRVNVVLPPAGYGGPYLTIRKFLRNIEKLENLVEHGTLDGRMAAFLAACVRGKVNMLFIGATGSGKTTTLEVLSGFIPEQERIIIIEDTVELALRQQHVVRLLTRPPNVEGRGEITLRDLFINTLRMRPSRIIVGEIRGREALDYLTSLNSGHGGSLAVMHAASPEDAVLRLETLCALSGINLAPNAVRRQIASGVDIIIYQLQYGDGVRRIGRITEVVGLDDMGDVMLKDVFRFNEMGVAKDGKVIGKYQALGHTPTFMDRVRRLGVNLSQDAFKADPA